MVLTVPYPCNTGWGDGPTNPIPPACEPRHRGTKARQADGTVRALPAANGGGGPDTASGAGHGDTTSLSGRRIHHTPHGGADGIMAYDNLTGVTGKQDSIFQGELWNGGADDYVSEDGLPDISCPGNTIRCIVSIDTSIKQDQWRETKETASK